MKPNLEYKVEKFLEKEFKSSVGKLVLYDRNGDYLIFGKYVIKKLINEAYLVVLTGTATEKVFFKLKNAVSWCIFDHRNMIVIANRILWLDQQAASIEAGLELHQRLFTVTKKVDQKLIYIAKLKEEKIKKTLINDELKRYKQQADIFQQTNLR
jgi:hypothetical protein